MTILYHVDDDDDEEEGDFDVDNDDDMLAKLEWQLPTASAVVVLQYCSSQLLTLSFSTWKHIMRVILALWIVDILVGDNVIVFIVLLLLLIL